MGGSFRGLKPSALLESMSANDAISSRRSKGSSDHMAGSIRFLVGCAFITTPECEQTRGAWRPTRLGRVLQEGVEALHILFLIFTNIINGLPKHRARPPALL